MLKQIQQDLAAWTVLHGGARNLVFVASQCKGWAPVCILFFNISFCCQVLSSLARVIIEVFSCSSINL